MKITKRFKNLGLASVMTMAVMLPAVAVVFAGQSTTYAQDTTLEKRIEQYQKEFNISLSKSKAQRFKLRCGVAQTVMENLRGRIAIIQEKRSKVYSSITDRLTETQTKLDEKQIDTTKLKSQTDTLKEKVNEFNTNLATYKQAVEDMADMDCAADPSGFNAALLTARKAHDKLVIAVGDIRTYINNTIKPTLLQIKEQLGQQRTEGEGNATERTN